VGNRAVSDTFGTSRDELQERLRASPFNAWLGLRIESVRPGQVDFVLPWRSEFTGTPQLNRAHGGLVAALADTAGGYTLMAQTGVTLSTVDLRVDFHQAAGPGQLLIKGTVVHRGRRLSCVDVQIFDADGGLVATGRGTYYTPLSSPESPRAKQASDTQN
jgi:uncharacterized protein (TIGR00369 family)